MTVPLVAGREPSVSLCVGLSFPEGMSALSAPVLTLRDYKFKPTPPPQTKAPRGSALEDKDEGQRNPWKSRGFHTERIPRAFKRATRHHTHRTPPPRPRSKQFALKLQHDLVGGGFRKPRASVGKLLPEKAR